jgi:hypothetical protein
VAARLNSHVLNTKMTKPAGRTLVEFGALSRAERMLLDACAQGTVAQVGANRPNESTPENSVRAGFVAFLAMGGDEGAPIHNHGVRLQGAWVDGALTLHGATVPNSLRLWQCQFMEAVNLSYCELNGSLAFSGSLTETGLDLDGAVIKGDVFLNNQFGAAGEVRLLGAQIGGDLICGGAQLDGKGGYALSMDRAVIGGGVFLDEEFRATGSVRLLGTQIDGSLGCSSAQLDGKDENALSMDGAVIKGDVFLDEKFQAVRQVRLLGTQIGGNLACGSAQLDGNGGEALSMGGAVVKGDVCLDGEFRATGEVRLLGVQIGGNLNCRGGTFTATQGFSFSAEGAQVVGSWFLQNLPRPLEKANLQGFCVGRLVDESDAWGQNLALDGFSYERLAGAAPVDAPSRIAWLRLQRSTHLGDSTGSQSFRPQPWKHLQRVLRDMGHAEDARQVAIAFEDHVRHIGLIGQTPASWGPARSWIYKYASVFLHWAFNMLIGYGYRPLRLVGWMVGVWFFGAAIYWCAAVQGVMGPSNPLVFNDPKLRAACHANWYVCTELPQEYAGFSPLAYSLDLLLPLVNLGQEKDWAPLIPQPRASWWSEWLGHWTFKHVTRLVVWLEIMFGWVASLLLVAVFSGLTKRRDE